ncbi:MAG: hypothetical protein MUF72_02045 [Elainella sp. Prado103]|jgi:hypothetical protein|nr:hypothetical protein [Elainella sp. Prado103]
MTLLLIFLRLLQLLEFLASPLGITTVIWCGCYWLMLSGIATGIGMATLVATVCAACSYCYLEQSLME